MKNWELAKKGNKIDGVRAYADKKKIKFYEKNAYAPFLVISEDILIMEKAYSILGRIRYSKIGILVEIIGLLEEYISTPMEERGLKVLKTKKEKVVDLINEGMESI